MSEKRETIFTRTEPDEGRIEFVRIASYDRVWTERVLLAGHPLTRGRKKALEESIRFQQEASAVVPGVAKIATFDSATYCLGMAEFYGKDLAKQLAEGREAKVSGETALRHVVGAIVRVLVEVKRRFERAHGALGPYVVLIAGESARGETHELATAVYALSDFKPPRARGWELLADDTRAGRVPYEASDLHNLGCLILQLVTGPLPAPYADIDVRVVDASDESDWGRLGGRAAEWRKLAYDLVGIRDQGGGLTLEDVARRLQIPVPAAPGAGDRLRARAEDAYKNREFAQALEAYQQLLRTEPGDAEASGRIATLRKPPTPLNVPMLTLEAGEEAEIHMEVSDELGRPVDIRPVAGQAPVLGNVVARERSWVYQARPGKGGHDTVRLVLDNGQGRVEVAVSVTVEPDRATRTEDEWRKTEQALVQARGFLKSGNHRRALELFREVQQARPSDPEVTKTVKSILSPPKPLAMPPLTVCAGREVPIELAYTDELKRDATVRPVDSGAGRLGAVVMAGDRWVYRAKPGARGTDEIRFVLDNGFAQSEVALPVTVQEDPVAAAESIRLEAARAYDAGRYEIALGLYRSLLGLLSGDPTATQRIAAIECGPRLRAPVRLEVLAGKSVDLNARTLGATDELGRLVVVRSIANTPPKLGQLTETAEHLVYQARPGTEGDDSFRVRLETGQSSSEVAIRIMVGTPPAPVPAPDPDLLPAGVAFTDGEWSRALALYLAVLERNPDHVEARSRVQQIREPPTAMAPTGLQVKAGESIEFDLRTRDVLHRQVTAKLKTEGRPQQGVVDANGDRCRYRATVEGAGPDRFCLGLSNGQAEAELWVTVEVEPLPLPDPDLAPAAAAFEIRDYGRALALYLEVLGRNPDHAEASQRVQQIRTPPTVAPPTGLRVQAGESLEFELRAKDVLGRPVTATPKAGEEPRQGALEGDGGVWRYQASAKGSGADQFGFELDNGQVRTHVRMAIHVVPEPINWRRLGVYAGVAAVVLGIVGFVAFLLRPPPPAELALRAAEAAWAADPPNEQLAYEKVEEALRSSNATPLGRERAGKADQLRNLLLAPPTMRLIPARTELIAGETGPVVVAYAVIGDASGKVRRWETRAASSDGLRPARLLASTPQGIPVQIEVPSEPASFSIEVVAGNTRTNAKASLQMGVVANQPPSQPEIRLVGDQSPGPRFPGGYRWQAKASDETPRGGALRYLWSVQPTNGVSTIDYEGEEFRGNFEIAGDYRLICTVQDSLGATSRADATHRIQRSPAALEQAGRWVEAVDEWKRIQAEFPAFDDARRALVRLTTAPSSNDLVNASGQVGQGRKTQEVQLGLQSDPPDPRPWGFELRSPRNGERGTLDLRPDGRWTYSANPGAPPGTDFFDVRMTNGFSAQLNFRLSVVVRQSAPPAIVSSVGDRAEAVPGVPLAIEMTVTPDPEQKGERWTYGWSCSPLEGASFEGPTNGLKASIVFASERNYEIQFVAVDGTGIRTPQRIAVTVNPSPEEAARRQLLAKARQALRPPTPDYAVALASLDAFVEAKGILSEEDRQTVTDLRRPPVLRADSVPVELALGDTISLSQVVTNSVELARDPFRRSFAVQPEPGQAETLRLGRLTFVASAADWRYTATNRSEPPDRLVFQVGHRQNKTNVVLVVNVRASGALLAWEAALKDLGRGALPDAYRQLSEALKPERVRANQLPGPELKEATALLDRMQAVPTLQHAGPSAFTNYAGQTVTGLVRVAALDLGDRGRPSLPGQWVAEPGPESSGDLAVNAAGAWEYRAPRGGAGDFQRSLRFDSALGTTNRLTLRFKVRSNQAPRFVNLRSPLEVPPEPPGDRWTSPPFQIVDDDPGQTVTAGAEGGGVRLLPAGNGADYVLEVDHVSQLAEQTPVRLRARDSLEESSTFNLVMNYRPAQPVMRIPGGSDRELVWVPMPEIAGAGDWRAGQGQGIWVAREEVSNEDWRRVMGENPPNEFGDPLPVVGVALEKAKAYCRKLNETAGSGRGLKPGWEFQLPSANQARGYLQYDYEPRDMPNEGLRPRPAAAGKPNRFGAVNAEGNAREWTRDGNYVVVGWGRYTIPPRGAMNPASLVSPMDNANPELFVSNVGLRVIYAPAGQP